ncbi:aminotransferase class V [Legionella steelei]|uniref:Aminotransferase class V n=1 Tax=Legionella steelei TaxID=947033 RepID=A0A0W0ZPH7_9GAMM|nr:aminotransferase class V-fold PLP-dependent enzyme [Legionella steelei]KTD71099.1 aminotransferase class V [Legionella steelei]
MINWDVIRDLFPVAKQQTYFMTAGGGALPLPVLKAIQNRYETVAQLGGRAFGENIQIMEHCREKIAKLINADKEHIAFIPHVSFGMNAIAQSLEPQNSVLIAKNDFGSTVLPWNNNGHNIHWVDSMQELLETISNKNMNQISSIVTSFIHYGNGYKLPLELIKEYCPDANFIVNGTQGIGAFPIDVKKQKIAALICSCYKWLGCGEGIAFMYIHPDFFKKLQPSLVGWRSVESAMSFDGKCSFYNTARIFELGWDNMTIFSGLDAALDLINELSIPRISERIQSLTNYLVEKIITINIPIKSDYPGSYRSGITLLGPFNNLEHVMKKLEENNIWVTQRDGGIRISLHYFNNEDDIDHLVNVLSQIELS